MKEFHKAAECCSRVARLTAVTAAFSGVSSVLSVGGQTLNAAACRGGVGVGDDDACGLLRSLAEPRIFAARAVLNSNRANHRPCKPLAASVVFVMFFQALLLLLVLVPPPPAGVAALKGLPDKIPIGGIFLTGEGELRAVFEHAIEVHNYRDQQFFVTPHVEVVDSDDPFLVAKKFCSILKNGTFALVATTTASSYETIVSYSNTFQIPLVSPSFPFHTRLRPAKYGISMRPDYLQAILDLIRHYGWKQIVYIYDSDAGLLKLQNLYKLTTDDYKLEIVKVRRVTSALDANKFLVKLDNETRDQLKHVIIDCEAELAREIIINHVRHPIVGRRTFHFLLGGLIMDEFANNPAMEFGAVNITGFRLVQKNSSRAYEEVFTERSRQNWPDLKTRKITSEAALMYDGTRVVLGAFKQLLSEYPAIFAKNFRRGEVYNNNSRGIDCKREKIMPWEHGNEILQRLRNINGIRGLSGNISFDSSGGRTNYTLDIVEVTVNSDLTTIAEWNSQKGFVFIAPKYRRVFVNSGFKSNKTYVVTTILEEPYLMPRKTEPGINLTGNARYEGYSKDLADLIAEKLNFTYELRIVGDGKYGGQSADSESGWNGMVGELIRNEADMAIAPLTITSARERVIDFTKPFMSLGISIMIKKPMKKKPGVFSFMNPLSREIWMCIIFAYVGVSVVLFLVSRFSPHEWRYEETFVGPTLSNDFSLYNSLWFSLGAFMRRGCDICPRYTCRRSPHYAV